MVHAEFLGNEHLRALFKIEHEFLFHELLPLKNGLNVENVIESTDAHDKLEFHQLFLEYFFIEFESQLNSDISLVVYRFIVNFDI